MMDYETFDRDLARLALKEALGEVGLSAALPQVVWAGTSVVFRVGDYAARVVSTQSSITTLVLLAEIARFLNANGVRATRPADELSPSPIRTANGYVFFWKWVPHRTDVLPSVSERGAMLRRLHDLPTPDWLPPTDPFKLSRLRLKQIADHGLASAGELSTLETALANVEDRWARATVRNGFIHGDYTNGNVIVSPDGLVMTDFENTGLGPKEWDLIQPVMAHRRFGAAIEEVDEFFNAYGVHPDLKMLEDLSRGKEVRATIWCFASRPMGPVFVAESLHRLGTLADPDDRTPWQPLDPHTVAPDAFR